MKKLKKMIIASTIIVLFYSCKKDEVVKQDSPINQTELTDQTKNSGVDESTIIDNHIYSGITVENGVLVFESVEYFESLVDDESQDYCVEQLTTYLNSTTFNSYGKNHVQNSEYEDSFMDAIMNNDKVVKIGKWFIHVNSGNDVVKAISDQAAAPYATLLGNAADTNIIFMTTTDDVLDELTEGAGQNRNGFCKESGVGASKDDANFGLPATSANEAILEHKKFGIYFKIHVKITSPNFYNQIAKFNFTKKSYKKTCQTMENMSLTPYTSPLFNGSYTYVLTSGTRNFNKYWIRISAGERGTNVYGYAKDADLDHYLEIRKNM